MKACEQLSLELRQEAEGLFGFFFLDPELFAQLHLYANY